MEYPPPRPSPQGGRELEDPGSERADPDVRREWVEDDSGGRLGEKVGRFLRHHLARPSDLNHVRNRGGPEQEGRLAGSHLQSIEQPADIPRIAEVALRLQLGGLQAQLPLQDLVVEHRYVELGDRIRGTGALNIDGKVAPTLPSL